MIFPLPSSKQPETLCPCKGRCRIWALADGGFSLACLQEVSHFTTRTFTAVKRHSWLVGIRLPMISSVSSVPCKRWRIDVEAWSTHHTSLESVPDISSEWSDAESGVV